MLNNSGNNWEQQKKISNEQAEDTLPEFRENVASINMAPESFSISVLPLFPPQNLESSATMQHCAQTLAFRKPSVSFDGCSFVRSQSSVDSFSKRTSCPITDNTPDIVSKAIGMVQAYPIMSVRNTPFVKLIFFNCSCNESASHMSICSALSLLATDQEAIGESVANVSESSDRLRIDSRVILAAVRIKRACMWEVIIKNCLAHCAWVDLFRRFRLRVVLEKLMLPVILRKRESRGTSFRRFVCKKRRSVCTLLSADDGVKPEVNLLREKLKFLSSCCNLKFFEELSEIVLCYRYSLGSAIVTVGSPAQDALYILVSGRCDTIIPSTDGGKRPMKRVKMAQGESFGGIFGGTEVFTKLYRAISDCIIWVIRRERFEMLFDQHADESMKAAYLKALKEHNMERLVKNYPLPQCISRVPIYRLLDVSVEQYAKDFTPLVLTKGDVLFNQGDAPGAVYCLLEGQVERAQVGVDMTYETGTRQILSLNDSDNSFALSTRFVLLGEEPHILPGLLRYRCTVFSRFALFFKIDGVRLVNALLDDAKLFLDIRAKLTTQTRLSMKLSPEAILSVPLFAEWPRSQINVILNAAEPRILDRCASICEPAQPIREIFFVTRGNVRDPRQSDHIPLQPHMPYNVMSEESKESSLIKGGKPAKFPNKHFSGVLREKGNLLTTCTSSPELNGQGQPFSGSEEVSKNWTTQCIRWSLFSQEGNETKVDITYPDEHQDLSPPLPPNPTKNIMYAIGGGWEGLLVEKWPSGWETTTTVELWAVSTLTIRTEFNSMPKSLQSVILQNARLMQMSDLGLSAPLIAKLPPMSMFMPPEKRLTKHALGIEKSGVQEKGGYNKSVTSFSRKHVSSCYSHEYHSATTGSKHGNMTGEFSASQTSTVSGSSAVMSVPALNSLRKTGKKPNWLPKILKHTLLSRSKTNKGWNTKKDADANKVAKAAHASAPAADHAPVAEVSKPKAGPPPLCVTRRLISKPLEKPPVITAELCAIYGGQKPETCIIREPQKFDAKQRLGAKGITLAADQQPKWPVSSGAGKQWFREVPSFAPLPGQSNNKDCVFSIPSLMPNSALMVKREKGYDSVLASQVNYFVSLAHSRREKMKNELASTQQAAVIEPIFLKDKELFSSLVSRPVPGRHAYRL